MQGFHSEKFTLRVQAAKEAMGNCRGYTDSHMHLVEYGKALSQVDLRGIGDMDSLVSALKQAAATDTALMPTIEAFGWNQETLVEGRMPTRWDLDLVATDRPVLLSRICGHVTAVNSYVLRELSVEDGLTEALQNLDGGQIDVDSEGVPTGILRERARDLLKERGYYNGTPQMVEACILKAQEDLLQKGITCVHSDDMTCFPNMQASDILEVFSKLSDSGQLQLEVVAQAQGDPEYLMNWQKNYEKAQVESHKKSKFSIGSLKLFTDGSLGARTAYLLSPYSDDLQNPQNRGIAIYQDAALIRRFEQAFAVGLPLTVHAIGDAAIDQVIRGFEHLAALGARDYYLRRCGIVHCQVTNLDLLSRMADLGLRAYIQPIFLHEDAKVVYSRLGAERAESSYLWRTMRDMGIPLWMGSDAPIETPDPIKGIFCATQRATLDEEPIMYLPHEALTIEEAIDDYMR